MLFCLLAAVLFAGCASQPFMTEVSPGIYEGCMPKTRAHYESLRQHGIRTILNLQIQPWDISAGRKRAQKNGIAYRSVPIPASPRQPKEARVNEALRILDEPDLHPIFINCRLGRDRATLIVGLYRVYYEGWSAEAAWAEMLRKGFKTHWTLMGLKHYFWHHSQRPDWLKAGEAGAGEKSR